MSDPYDTAAERKSILPPSLRFKGELSADEDLLIQGSIEGVIHHTQRVTIGSQGNVKASITAQIIKVEGSVEGDLQAERSVYVDESGNLKGNIKAPSVCLAEGSTFNGAIDMGNRTAQRGSPAAKTGASRG